MGAFAVILNARQLQQMVRLLLDKMKASKSKADLFTQIMCFAQIARNVGNKLAREQVAEVFPLLCAQAH